MTSPPAVDQFVRSLAHRYQVGQRIGSGTKATVFLALDLKHRRPVVIRLLEPELAATMRGERLFLEISILAKLQHPHILPVLDSGEAAGSYYFVTTRVDGETLQERLGRGDRPSVAEAIRILTDLADALACAHRHGVPHRDITPENIVLAGRHAMLTNFGLAKAVSRSRDQGVEPGGAVATPAGPAPATADLSRGEQVDIRALGAVGYEILAGRPPLLGAISVDIPGGRMAPAPESIGSIRPDIPPSLARVIDRCLTTSPLERWPRVEEIAAELDRLAASAEVTPVSVARPMARRWVPWLAGVTTAIAVAAVAWGFRLRRTVSPPARPERVSFLGTVREAAISPDGSFLAYITANPEGQQLWVLETTAGAPLRIAASERIVGVGWTSGGRELSYTEGPADDPTTRVISRLGGSSVLVGRGRGIVSPDGNLVLLATGGDPTVLVLGRARGDTIRLHRPPDGWLTGVAWSPRSDRLAMAIVSGDKAESSIHLVGFDDRAREIHRAPRQIYGLAFGPGGRSLYYLADAGPGGKDLERLELDADGTVRTARAVALGLPILDESRRYPTGTSLSVSGDGSGIVFVEEERWSNLARFRIGTTTMPEPEPFTMGTALYTAPRLSPDGTRLAAFVSRPGGASLGTVPFDGNALEELAVTGLPGSPAWSPDGSAIAYTAGVPDSGLRLSIADLRSGSRRRLAGSVGAELVWGTSGLFVLRPGNHGLLRADIAAGAVGAPLSSDSTTSTFSPRISPDGRWIAVMAYPGSAQPVTLSLIAVNGGGSRELLRGAYRPVGWSGNGEVVFAARGSFTPAPEQVLAVPVGGGAPRVLVSLPAAYTAEDVSADGRLVIARRVDSRSDVWRLPVAEPSGNRSALGLSGGRRAGQGSRRRRGCPPVRRA